MKSGSTTTLKSYVRRTVFNDESFLSLSDNAKLVYLYFLITPRTIQCLGIIPMGPVGVLEGLGWGLERASELLKIMDDLEAKKLVFCDRTKNVTFIPETVLSNPPSNDNIVKGWANRANEVHDCAVKDMWIDSVRQAISDTYPERLETFEAAFFGTHDISVEGFRKGIGKGFERGDGLFQTDTEEGVVTEREKVTEKESRREEPSLFNISFFKKIPAIHEAYLQELEKLGFDVKKAIDWKSKEKRMICGLIELYGVDKCLKIVKLFVRTFPTESVKRKWNGSPTIPLLHSWRDYYFNSAEFREIAEKKEYSGSGFGEV